MLHLKAPAKLNLRLEILAREESGFHQLETLFCALELADELWLEPAPAGVDLLVEGGPAPTSVAADNLVHRAADQFLRAAGIGGGVRIRLRKHIPVGAGLGGGSSDAAATILGLDRLHREPLGQEGRLQLAAGLGSDVPFFLCGSPLALAWGRGGRLLPLDPLPSLPVLLALPGPATPTGDAFQQLARLRAGRAEAAAPRLLRLSHLRDWDWVAQQARNDFEELIFERLPVLAQVRRALLEAGALLALLTGSGSAYFGVFRDHARLQSAQAALAPLGVRTLVSRTASPASPPPFG